MNERRRQHGPLSPLQATILDRLMAGERQQTLAKELGFSESYISGETSLCTAKLRARTTAHACTLYATAKAYREAADLLDQSSRAHLQEDGIAEDHANHILTGLAGILRERAAALLPK